MQNEFIEEETKKGNTEKLRKISKVELPEYLRKDPIRHEGGRRQEGRQEPGLEGRQDSPFQQQPSFGPSQIQQSLAPTNYQQQRQEERAFEQPYQPLYQPLEYPQYQPTSQTNALEHLDRV